MQTVGAPTTAVLPCRPGCRKRSAGHVLVIPTRLERVTDSLEGCCSIQLSYGTENLFNSGKITLFYSFKQPCHCPWMLK
jgi:hypothetical protein